MKETAVVMSLAGHDKGTLYVVVGESENKLLLCDGKNKLLKSPKSKNKKHLTTCPCRASRFFFEIFKNLYVLKEEI